jgi:glucose-6-phosphate 1-dehydrogenase
MTVGIAAEPLRAGALAPTPQPAALVLFRATGDLARRRILPALHTLARGRARPEPFALVGVAHDPLSHDAFREIAAGAVRRFSRRPPDEPPAP